MLAPDCRRRFTGILAEMRPGDMVMLTNLRASQPGDIAFRLVRAGAILAIGFPMIDPLHFKARMKIVPGSRFVGMDNAASGDATTNDWDSLGLMLHHCRHGRAAPLAHHHDATALAALVLASTPIDASEPIIFWPDVAAKPSAIDLNDPAQTGRRDVRRQSASQLVQQDERGLRMQPEIAAQLKLMPLAALTNKQKAMSSVRTGSFRHASEVPLVAENCRWQALHLNSRRHR
jgi:hypothetical protein